MLADTKGGYVRSFFPSEGRFYFSLLGLWAAVLAVPSNAQDSLPIIDTHAHLNFTSISKSKGASMDFPVSVAGALERMEQNGFSRTILMPQPSPPEAANRWEVERLDFAVANYPSRISRGGGGTGGSGRCHTCEI
jgi:hypothetical protein